MKAEAEAQSWGLRRPGQPITKVEIKKNWKKKAKVVLVLAFVPPRRLIALLSN